MESFIDEDDKRRYEKASELILKRNITVDSPRKAIVELLVEMARYENEWLKNKNISFQVDYDILLKKYECLLEKIKLQ